MKILIIQENGQHAANRIFRECFCMQRALDSLGHDTLVWGLNQQNQLIDFDSLVNWCDAILLLENYDTGWVPDLFRVSKYKVFWSIDSHCALDAHRLVESRNAIDCVLCSCLPDVDKFRNGVWFPNAYPRDLFGTVKVAKVGVGYCGSPGPDKRVELLATVARHIALRCDFGAIGAAMVRSIASYNVHLNMNIGHDINYRTFETCGAGVCLLTNETPGIHNLFNVNEHLVTYTDAADAVNKARALIADPDMADAIGKAGYKLASERHTYHNRAAELIRIINGEKVEYHV